MEANQLFKSSHLLFKKIEERKELYEKVQDAIIEQNKEKIIDALVDFINGWNKARRYDKNKLRIVIENLVNKLYKEKILELSRKSILNEIDKKEVLVIENEIIKEIFNALKNISGKNEKVATSKVLNVLFPQVFPLYDNNILKCVFERHLKKKSIKNYKDFIEVLREYRNKLDDLKEKLKADDVIIVDNRNYSFYKLVDEVLYLVFSKFYNNNMDFKEINKKDIENFKKIAKEIIIFLLDLNI